MNDSKQESKLSFKNKVYVLICLTITLLGVAFINNKFPGLRNELSDFLLIAVVLLGIINVFWKKK